MRGRPIGPVSWSKSGQSVRRAKGSGSAISRPPPRTGPPREMKEARVGREALLLHVVAVDEDPPADVLLRLGDLDPGRSLQR